MKDRDILARERETGRLKPLLQPDESEGSHLPTVENYL